MAWGSGWTSGIARVFGLAPTEAEAAPSVERDAWDTSAFVAEPPAEDEAVKQLPVIQPGATAPEPPPDTPVASEPRTAGLVDDPERHAALEPAIVAAMKTVFDPEIPVNIYDLGLIYDIIVEASSVVGVRMTLTAPNCPAAQWLPGQVEDKVRRVDGVADVRLDVVFEPPWEKDKMSDAAKLQLGMW